MATTFELLQQGSSAPSGSTTWEYINDLKTGSGTGGGIIGSDVIVLPSVVSLSITQEEISVSVFEESNQTVGEDSSGLNINIDEVDLNV